MSSVPENPIIETSEIQGNILAGFKKDYCKLIFAAIADDSIMALRRWLRTIAKDLSYTDVVSHFNRAFSAARRSLSEEPTMSATWANLAITSDGIKRICSASEMTAFEPTFLSGPSADAGLVGEPPVGSPGGPDSWLIGGPKFLPDILLIIAGDEPQDVQATCDRYTKQLEALAVTAASVTIRIEDGHTRSAQPGHEHFGFKDCVSQPGIRGVSESAQGTLITKRWLDSGDPLASPSRPLVSPAYSAPGQPLCWPGEFVLGYPRKKEGSPNPMETQDDPVTDLTRNGSYLVYRRLRQDVATFRAETTRIAGLISANASFGAKDADFAGACLVGRWASGAPLIRTQQQDLPALGADSLASNNFLYTSIGVPPRYAPNSGAMPDAFPPAASDTPGKICPFIAHVRKVNPRAQTTDQGPAVRTLEHRILRRGIPYGTDYDPTDATSAAEDRGLQFLCYQSSIQRGFQFLMNGWANSEDLPFGGGVDPIIGQVAGAPRPISISPPNGSQISTNLNAPFVRTTGAAYLFSPSRSALEQHLGQ